MKDSYKRHRGSVRAMAIYLLAVGVAWLTACSPAPVRETAATAEPEPAEEAARGDQVGRPGGRLVFTLTSDPRTFNPATALSISTHTVLDLLHDDLMTFDPFSQSFGISLAEDWTEVSAPDAETGTVYRMALRRNVKFSDGEPFDAEDVLFTLQLILDPDVGSLQRDTLLIEGEPITVTAIDSHTLEVRLPAPVADAALLFERLYILPEHRLGQAYEDGELGTSWGVETPVSELAGLGPFKVAEYLPGERLVFERNPHFWGRDSTGGRLPYLDEVVALIVPDKQAGLLRFEAGEIDIFHSMQAEAFERIKASKTSLQMRDLGAGTAYEMLFFNLNDQGAESDPVLARKQGWFKTLKFRKAISRAIDRRGIVELVYGGRATPIHTQVTPGIRRWHAENLEIPETSVSLAKELLAEAGFHWNDDGRLLDADDVPVELTLITNSTNPRRVQTATVIQEDLSRLGMDVQVVPLDFGVLLDRVGSTFDYELGLLGLGRGGVDPSSTLSVWHSSGSNHLWHLGTSCPTTEWEQRIDELMHRQKSELDFEKRKRLYTEVQALVAENLPIVALVAPNVLVGADEGLGNFAPTIFDPPILWNVEHLYWRAAQPRAQ